MKRLRLTALSAPILLTLLAVPAASQNREHVQLTGDMRMLQEQTQRLQLVLGSLTEALEAITAQIDEQTNLTRKAFADQKLLVDNLTDDVRVLREKLDDTNVRITSLSEEVEALRLAVPPVQVLPQGTEPTADAADGAPLPRALVAPAAVVPGVSPQRLFDQAMADYMAGQWDLSIQGFDAYIKTFPRSERADDAQHYIGRTYYNDGRFREAVQAFDRVNTDYPTGDVLPDTLYMRGLALDSLGETDGARESWELLLEKHPETPAGVLAKQALDRLNRLVC